MIVLCFDCKRNIIFNVIPMASVMCEHSSMQKEVILQLSNVKCHLYTLSINLQIII